MTAALTVSGSFRPLIQRVWQHSEDCPGSRSVAEEVADPDPVHGQPEGPEVGAMAAGRALGDWVVDPFDCRHAGTSTLEAICCIDRLNPQLNPQPKALVGRVGAMESARSIYSFTEWQAPNTSFVVQEGFGDAPCGHANIAASISSWSKRG